MSVPAGALLPGSYDPLVVTLSIVIAVAASYAALDLAGRVTASKGWSFTAWWVCSSIATGIGIWSMHFTGMLAFHLPVPVSYYWPDVLCSFLVAVFGAAVSLYIVSRQKMGTARAVSSGVVLGCGIAGLHYMDIFAMRMPAEMRFNSLVVALSVAFAIAFSYAAQRLTFYFRDAEKLAWRKIGSAFIMAAAICAMHYTGMAAATFTATGTRPDMSRSVSISSLGSVGIISVTLLVLGFAMLSSFVDRRFHAHALELALAEAKMELAYVGRAASLAELAASIAHEINQPLGAVVNSASAASRWLAMQPPNLDEAREAAAQTVRHANRASDVIASVRALLKKEPSQMMRLDVNEIIREVLNLTSIEIANARITLKTSLATHLPAVLGDRLQLQEVMLNLITNAMEAMSSADDRPRELLIKSTVTEESVRVLVQDTGVGLKPEDLDRVFRPFFTTKSHGIGMGLSISRSIIEAHGGRLWATSRDSSGAAFHFTLPKGG